MFRRALHVLFTILALVSVAAANFGIGPASWLGMHQPAPPK